MCECFHTLELSTLYIFILDKNALALKLFDNITAVPRIWWNVELVNNEMGL